MNESLKATPEEIKKAKDLNYSKKLLKTDLSYIKLLEKWKPLQYANLYDELQNLMKEFDDVFAKYTCDRRTPNVKPVRLGIKPGYENKNVTQNNIHLTLK